MIGTLNLQVQLVIVANHRVIRSGRWYLAVRLGGLARILNQKVPLIRRVLQSIQVECYQVVEEITLNLAPKNVYPGPKDVEGMAVTSGRPWSGR